LLGAWFYIFQLSLWITAVWAANLNDSDRFFDFAEERYSRYFSPAGQETVTYKDYLVRYYPETNIYLATLEDGVYVYGKSLGEGIIYVGELSDFITLTDTTPVEQQPETINLTALILSQRSENCADYTGSYISGVSDVSRSLSFEGNLSISVDNGKCSFSSNNIPNHDMGEGGAFATTVSEVNQTFDVTASPEFDSSPTALTLSYDNAILLNGVKVYLFAAACYDVADEKIGCNDINQPWRLDPMSPDNQFGTDTHNAHT